MLIRPAEESFRKGLEALAAGRRIEALARFEAAVAHYQVTGSRAFLDVAIKNAAPHSMLQREAWFRFTARPPYRTAVWILGARNARTTTPPSKNA